MRNSSYESSESVGAVVLENPQLPEDHDRRLTPLAEADLEEIRLYTSRRRSSEQADEYHRKIIANRDK